MPAGRKYSRQTYMIDNARIKYNARKSPSGDRPRPRPNVPVCEGLPQQRRLRIKKRAKARKSPSSDRPRPRPNVPACEGLPQQRRLWITKRANTRFMTANIGSMTGKSREIADIVHIRTMIVCLQETHWKGSKAKDIGEGFMSHKWDRNHLEYRML